MKSSLDGKTLQDDSGEVPNTQHRTESLVGNLIPPVKYSLDGKTSQGGQVHDVLQIK